MSRTGGGDGKGCKCDVRWFVESYYCVMMGKDVGF
jgi:hypothetical protein